MPVFSGRTKYKDISDISFFPGHMSFNLHEIKNNQYREGHSPIRLDKVICPVAISEKLLSHLSERDCSLPVVRRTVWSKSNETFHDSKGVSYSTMRDEFRKFLKPFVSDVKAYGPHSIKSGAASNPGRRKVGYFGAVRTRGTDGKIRTAGARAISKSDSRI